MWENNSLPLLQGIILVYDITKRSSYENLITKWLHGVDKVSVILHEYRYVTEHDSSGSVIMIMDSAVQWSISIDRRFHCIMYCNINALGSMNNVCLILYVLVFIVYV